MLSNSAGASTWPLVFFVALHFLAAYGIYSRDDWVSIDCGNEEFFIDDDLNFWASDDLYTNAGTDKLAQVNQPNQLMNTLRSFPNSNEQSCYELPIIEQKLRYLVRSGFLYGDYDGLARPPTFDLRLDGKKLSTIKIPSISDAIIDEIAYTSEESGVMNFCLVPQSGGGVPFISSLQAVPTDGSLYKKMPLTDSFRLVARTSFGKADEDGTFLDSDYERQWTIGTTPPNCNNVSTSGFFDSSENDPPSSVLQNAIESETASSPIILTVAFPQTTARPQSAYFAFYFTETSLTNNRSMRIIIAGQELSTVTTDPTKCTVASLYPVIVSGSAVNVTIAAADSTGLPPLINAMEVFTKISTSGGGRAAPILVSFVLMIGACVLTNLL